MSRLLCNDLNIGVDCGLIGRKGRGSSMFWRGRKGITKSDPFDPKRVVQIKSAGLRNGITLQPPNPEIYGLESLDESVWMVLILTVQHRSTRQPTKPNTDQSSRRRHWSCGGASAGAGQERDRGPHHPTWLVLIDVGMNAHTDGVYLMEMVVGSSLPRRGAAPRRRGTSTRNSSITGCPSGFNLSWSRSSYLDESLQPHSGRWATWRQGRGATSSLRWARFPRPVGFGGLWCPGSWFYRVDVKPKIGKKRKMINE
jgi:hypothetical protein